MAADLSVGGGWRATEVATPFGPLVVVASDDGIVAADLGRAFAEVVAPIEAGRDVAVRRDDRGLADVRREARAYFAGRLRRFRTPVDLGDSHGFRRRVYEATIDVPYGELRTYGDVAAAAGSHRAWRAAGSALRACPVELWIPCHRVVPSGPTLGTYGGRPDVRAGLLRLEGSLPDGAGGRSRGPARR